MCADVAFKVGANRDRYELFVGDYLRPVADRPYCVPMNQTELLLADLLATAKSHQVNYPSLWHAENAHNRLIEAILDPRAKLSWISNGCTTERCMDLHTIQG